MCGVKRVLTAPRQRWFIWRLAEAVEEAYPYPIARKYSLLSNSAIIDATIPSIR